MDGKSISVSGLSKVYQLYKKPSHRLLEAIHPLRRKYHTDFHALSDVTFDIPRGETVGIIGRNGSGKSTLLKIITGVLTPSAGAVSVRGRVSALLELGMGFNPEITGVENVFFTAAILGIPEEEMRRKLPEVLAFADIGDYAEQPVKSYSSGMFVRLAFAVAIHVEPEILIIDEALSVGDMRFQQKCYRKIRSFRDAGATILFVSHDTGAITSFCDRCIWMKDGRVERDGPPAEVVREYVAYMSFDSATEEAKPRARAELPSGPDWTSVEGMSSFGDGGVRIERVALLSRETGQALHLVEGGEEVEYAMALRFRDDLRDLIYGLVLKDGHGNSLLALNTFVHGLHPKPRAAGEEAIVKLRFRMPRLANGDFTISPAVAEGTMESHVEHHWVHDATVFQIAHKGARHGLGSVLVLDDLAFEE
jgi:lipopolysaccharide transport system ATP-binding protein/teichoic acid transport system ATP-binding protein